MRKRRGFTLVELLLTISLAALILIEAGSVFRAASVGHRRTRLAEQRSRRANAAMEVIAGDIENLANLAGADRPAVEVLPVDGGAGVLLRLRTGEPATVDYFLLPDSPAAGLLARRRQLWSGETAYEPAARRVEAFDVRCFDGAAWSDTWTTGLPRMIEVTVELRRRHGEPAVFRRRFDVLIEGPLDAPGETGGGP